MKTSIVIPTFNGKHMLAECIASIRAYTAPSYELIVVDNGSSDGTPDWCRDNRIAVVSLPGNRGFPVACNFGLRLAAGDTVLLLNNDVVAGRNWLDNLLSALYSSPEVGMVGPYANAVFGKQLRKADYRTIEQYHAAAEAYNRPDPGKWLQVRRLVGFCLAFKREVMDRIGLLDERFSPGHYEDDDYCYRARLAGYKLMIAGDVIVHHHGSASFRKQPKKKVSRLVDRNWRKFMDKWGVDPRKFV